MVGHFHRRDRNNPENPEKVRVPNKEVSDTILALLDLYADGDPTDPNRPGLPPKDNTGVKWQMRVFQRIQSPGDNPDLGDPYTKETYSRELKERMKVSLKWIPLVILYFWWDFDITYLFTMGIPQRIPREPPCIDF